MRLSGHNIFWALTLALVYLLAADALAQQGGISLQAIRNVAIRELLFAAQNAEQQQPDKAEAALREAVQMAEQREPPDLPASLLWQAGFLQRHKRLDEARAIAERALNLLIETVGPNDLKTAVAHSALGSYEHDAGEFEKAELHFQAVLDAYRRDPVNDRDGEVWVTAWNLGMARFRQQRYAEAEALLKQALAIKRLYAFDPVWIPRLNERLALISEGQNHIDDALTYFEIAVEMKRPAATADGDLAELLLRQARMLQRLHMYDWAAASAHRAYGERSRQLGADHRRTQDARQILSTILNSRDDPAIAQRAFRAKLAAAEGKPDQQSVIAWASAGLAMSLQKQKNLEEADRLAQRAVELTEQIEPRNVRRYVERLQLRGSIRADQGRFAEAESDYRRAADESVTAFGAGTDRVGNAQMLLAGILRDGGKLEDAEVSYLAALEIRKKSTELLPLSVTQVHLASLYGMLGQYGKAEDMAREALKIREADLTPNDALIADALYNLGIVYRYRQRFVEAEPILRRAFAIRRAAYGTANALVLGDMHALGTVLDGMGRSVDAEPLLRIVLSSRDELLGADSAEVAETLVALSSLLRRRGKLDDAAQLAERVIVIYRKLYGADDTVVALGLVALGQIDQARSDFDRAEQWFREALAIRLKAFGENHLMVASTYLDLGALSAARRQFEEAGGYAAKALRIVEARYPAEDPRALPMMAEHANLLLLSRDLDAAEERLKRVLEITERTHGPQSVDWAMASESMSYLFRMRGKVGNLERNYARPLATYRTALGAQHPAVARAMIELADYRTSIGEAKEALSLYDEAMAILKTAYGADAPALWGVLNNKALLLNQMNRETEAGQLFEQSIDLLRKGSRRETADLAVVITNYAWFCEQVGKREEADRQSAHALRIYRSLYGEERAPPTLPAPVLPPPPKEI